MQTVSLDTFASLQLKLTAKDEVITMLENRVLVLEEEIEELKEATDKTKVTKKDGKTYSTDTRMSIYDAIVSQVPTQNIPSLIEKLSQRTGEKLSALPHRTTMEQMARELDVIADLKAAELSMKISDLTVGFDATTQEGVHINSIHLTTKEECEVIAIDKLAGGTADDYCEQVTICWL